MDGNGIRERPIPFRRFLKNRIKDILFALVVLVQRRCLDAHGVRDLLHAHRVVPFLRKQPKGFPHNTLFGAHEIDLLRLANSY